MTKELRPILFRKNMEYVYVEGWSILEVELLKRSYAMYNQQITPHIAIHEIAKIHKRSYESVFHKLVSLGILKDTCDTKTINKTQFVKSECNYSSDIPFLHHNGKDSRYLNVNILNDSKILCLESEL